MNTNSSTKTPLITAQDNDLHPFSWVDFHEQWRLSKPIDDKYRNQHQVTQGVKKAGTLIDFYNTVCAPSGQLRKEDNHLFIAGELENDSRAFGSELLLFHAVVIDYDSGGMTLAQAYAKMDGIECIIFSSPSHTPAHPKWRLVCPVSTPLAQTEHSRLLDGLVGVLGLQIPPNSQTEGVQYIDGCSKKVKQMYYFGDTGNGLFETYRSRGAFIDQVKQEETPASNVIPIDSFTEMMNPALARLGLPPMGDVKDDHPDKWVIDLYNEHRQLDELLTEHNYDERAGRWLHPGSESRSPGLVIFPANHPQNTTGVQRGFSSNSTDPLHDPQGFTAFNALITLHHLDFTRGAECAKAWLHQNQLLPEQVLARVCTFSEVTNNAEYHNYLTNAAVPIADRLKWVKECWGDALWKPAPTSLPPPPQVQQKPDMAGQGTSAAPTVPTDESLKPTTIDLMQYLPDDMMFKRFVRTVAENADMPQSSVLLVGLGVVSGINSRAYAVAYPNGDPLPVSLYVVAGQPPATAKTRVLKSFQYPVFMAEKEVKLKKLQRAQEEAEGDKPPKPPKPEYTPPVYRTDSTAEGIDKNLPDTNGFFNLASSEQAIINTLLGLSYGDGKKNNDDLLLKGFNGEWHSSQRAGRGGFTGNVVSSITCFSQPDAVRTIFTVVEGQSTGMAERFLALEEPHNLGKRNHRKPYAVDADSKTAYGVVMRRITEQVLAKPQPEFEDLPRLQIQREAWELITDYRQKLEPKLGDGGEYSHATLRGIAGKVDMPIMKIAANLYLLEGGTGDAITERYITPAMNIVDALLKRTADLLQTLGVSGSTAEDDTVMDYVLRNGAKTRKQIVNAKRQSKVFTEAEQPAAAVGAAVDRLLASGQLIQGPDRKLGEGTA